MKLSARLAVMFDNDPMLPAIEAACERDDIALAVYMRCDHWRRLWMDTGTDKNVTRFTTRNPVWLARSLKLCREKSMPPPGWCISWSTAVALGESKKPDKHNIARAEQLDAVWVAITAKPQKGDAALFSNKSNNLELV